MYQIYNLGLRLKVATLLLLLISTVALASGDDTKLSSAIGASKVLDLEEKEHTLAPLWQEKPVVLVFIRHFG